MDKRIFILFLFVTLLALPLGGVLAGDVTQGEQIKNGTFDDGIDGWFQWIEGRAKAKIIAENGMAKIDINDEGGIYWWVQFSHQKMQVAQDRTYVVKFDAMSTVPRQVAIYLEHDGEPYTKYFTKNVQLTEKMTTYTYEFKQTEAGDDSVHLLFAMGQVGKKVGKQHTIYLDNVSFMVKPQ